MGRSAYVGTAECSTKEVDEAFEWAKEAQREWAKTPLSHRANALHEAARKLEGVHDAVANQLMEEIAKGKKEAKAEVQRTIDMLHYTAEEGLRALGSGTYSTSDAYYGQDRNKLCLCWHAPLGVVVAIPPFNYPGAHTATLQLFCITESKGLSQSTCS